MFAFIEKMMAQIAVSSANAAAGSASWWLAYQPKEPKNMKNK